MRGPVILAVLRRLAKLPQVVTSAAMTVDVLGYQVSASIQNAYEQTRWRLHHPLTGKADCN